MSPSNTRPKTSSGRPNRQNSQSRPAAASRSQQQKQRTFLPSVLKLRMPSVFNIVRACIYTAVLIWTIICLAIAVHFQGVLMSSDLTRFVPFAIFVCSASLLLILALLGFGLWGDRNPISTRVELGCLGLVGVLWLALGAFLGSSDADTADVECFSSSDAASEPFDMPGFNTETYHAQYHVLEAFSIFNIILIWAFLSLLLVLAVRHHRWGNRSVWLSSVTAFPWFASPDAQTGKLPEPATAKRNKSQRSQMTQRSHSSRRGDYPRPHHTSSDEKPLPGPPAQRPRLPESRRAPPSRNEEATHVYWMPHKAPEPIHTTDRRSPPRDKYQRSASPRR